MRIVFLLFFLMFHYVDLSAQYNSILMDSSGNIIGNKIYQELKEKKKKLRKSELWDLKRDSLEVIVDSLDQVMLYIKRKMRELQIAKNTRSESFINAKDFKLENKIVSLRKKSYGLDKAYAWVLINLSEDTIRYTSPLEGNNTISITYRGRKTDLGKTYVDSYAGHFNTLLAPRDSLEILLLNLNIHNFLSVYEKIKKYYKDFPPEQGECLTIQLHIGQDLKSPPIEYCNCEPILKFSDACLEAEQKLPPRGNWYEAFKSEEIELVFEIREPTSIELYMQSFYYGQEGTFINLLENGPLHQIFAYEESCRSHPNFPALEINELGDKVWKNEMPWSEDLILMPGYYSIPVQIPKVTAPDWGYHGFVLKTNTYEKRISITSDVISK